MLHKIAELPKQDPAKDNSLFYSVPMFLQVEITSRCNLKCRMCPLTLGTTSSSSAASQLADADWEQVKRLSVAAGRVLLVGFGEPLTHPQFLSMIHELDALGVETSFSTNGIGAEAVVGELASLHHLRHVNISIDSPDPTIYHDIRGGDVARALRGMQAIAAAMPDRVDVTVNSVVMKSNVRSLLRFPELLEQAGVRYYALNGLHDYTEEMRQEHIYSGRSLQTFLPSRRLHVVMDELKAVCERHGVQLLLNERTQLDFYRPDLAALEYFDVDPATPLTRACTVPFDSMYVDSNGKVYPCCHAAGAQPLGDLRIESAEQVWAGAAFEGFRNDLLDAKTTPNVCRSCTVAPLGEHPFRKYRAEIKSHVTEDETIRIEVQNTGTATWDRKHPLRLGASRPRDRKSIHRHSSWLSSDRLAEMKDDVVAPGQTTVLECQLTPAHTRSKETLQLLVEGRFWLPDTQFDLAPSSPETHLSVNSSPEMPAQGRVGAIRLEVEGLTPWQSEWDVPWISPQRDTGLGTSVLEPIVEPNWTASERVGTLRIGNAEFAVAQRVAAEPDRLTLFVTWKLLARHLSGEEMDSLRTLTANPGALIETLLADGECSHVAESLFRAFLDQTNRPSRVRAITHGLQTDAKRKVIERFLVLTDVRALFASNGFLL